MKLFTAILALGFAHYANAQNPFSNSEDIINAVSEIAKEI